MGDFVARPRCIIPKRGLVSPQQPYLVLKTLVGLVPNSINFPEDVQYIRPDSISVPDWLSVS